MVLAAPFLGLPFKGNARKIKNKEKKKISNCCLLCRKTVHSYVCFLLHVLYDFHACPLFLLFIATLIFELP